MARKLKVFLSSTAQDLTVFRKAVHARLASSPLFECIRQEDFGARPHPAPALCKSEVEQCDLFIGLIGMRRGWEPPDERDIVLKLAKRLKPDDTLDFDRAVAELENAITIAVDAIARGTRRSNEDEFVNDVLKAVAAHTQAGQTERAVEALDDALRELDTREVQQRETLKRLRLTLLHAAIEQDILRRDALSAARRVEESVAIEHSSDPETTFETLRKRQDEFYAEGRDKGINFSLVIAIEIARRVVDVATDELQRGTALLDLGTALQELGARESGTARLEEAAATYRKAIEASTRNVLLSTGPARKITLALCLSFSASGEQMRGSTRQLRPFARH